MNVAQGPEPATDADDSGSRHSGADHSAPDHSAPDHSAPDHSAPDHSAPDHSAPDHDDARRPTGSRPSGIRTDRPDRARVLLLTGPSGAGKSRLAARLHHRLGWPVIRLDDFYREVDDPDLPRSSLGIPDWDHVDSWDAAAAVVALRRLVDSGAVELPVYDIGASRVTGRHVITAERHDHILAEGLFAARLTEPLAAEGLLADTLCVRRNRWVTFVLRLVRDLSERRKPPHILIRRGLALLREEPQVIAEAEQHGARCLTPHEAEAELIHRVVPSGVHR